MTNYKGYYRKDDESARTRKAFIEGQESMEKYVLVVGIICLVFGFFIGRAL